MAKELEIVESTDIKVFNNRIRELTFAGYKLKGKTVETPLSNGKTHYYQQMVRDSSRDDNKGINKAANSLTRQKLSKLQRGLRK